MSKIKHNLGHLKHKQLLTYFSFSSIHVCAMRLKININLQKIYRISINTQWARQNILIKQICIPMHFIQLIEPFLGVVVTTFSRKLPGQCGQQRKNTYLIVFFKCLFTLPIVECKFVEQIVECIFSL